MMSLRSGPVVFAVEDTSAQITWRTVGVGDVTVECGPFRSDFESDGGPGVCELSDLEPDTVHSCTITTTAGTRVLPFRTLAPPPGRELYRFATMSDVHVGRTTFGLRKMITETDIEVPHPIRCARSAIAQMTDWGAQRVVVKGDLVDYNHPETWAAAAEVLGALRVPWHVLPGNHELFHGHQHGDAFALAAEAGVNMIDDVSVIDVRGLRMILMNSAVVGKDIGRWNPRREAVTNAAAAAKGPAMVLTHHQPQPAPWPTYFPPGIGSLTASRFVGSLVGANRQVFGTSGHTHRTRRRRVAGIPWTEVGSPKDYPGVWAGYVVHEGGIRQVVRRISDPSCLDWLDSTRRAAAGSFGLWSPGRLGSRCFTYHWPKQ